MILILSGLSVPDDRLTKIEQRIESGLDELAHVKESSVLDNTNSNNKIKELRTQVMKSSSEFNMEDLFSKYSD